LKQPESKSSTLVLGIGNLILTDDGVGIRVARTIKERRPEVEVIETSEAGLALLDILVDHDKLIIIDSVQTEQGLAGELFEVEFKKIKPNMDLCLSHGVDLSAAFEVGKGLGYGMPKEVKIYGIKITDNTTFCERCTEVIEKNIPDIAQQIIEREKL
jgi:hydrogenase maturation protease